MKEIIFEDPGLFASDIALLVEEDIRQLKKWGIQRVSPFEWLAYLAEEFGELAKAVNEVMYGRAPMWPVKKEAIQVATLALKIAKMSEEFHSREKKLHEGVRE